MDVARRELPGGGNSPQFEELLLLRMKNLRLKPLLQP
jgi:hypothetical protein